MKRLLLVPLALLSCKSSGTGSTSTALSLSLNVAANFSSSAGAATLKTTTTGTCAGRTDLTMDAPDLADGLDCDGDGGIVAHITPTQYALAVKRVSLMPADSSSSRIDFVADTGTLAKSEVIQFSTDDTLKTVAAIDSNNLKAGATYSGMEVELYYFQMTFPIDGVTRNVRIYMSDDDFAAEGNLGHHQGDITYINDSGRELGWIDDTWSDLSSTRGSAQNGAGGTDSETTHDRGFFGNAAFWNQTSLNQGAGQDLFLLTETFDTPLVIADLSSIPKNVEGFTTVTATFSTADTFYYEDFAPLGTGFNPGTETFHDTGEWAPLAPKATLSFITVEAL